MGRYDVYDIPSQGRTGYVLDVQADLLQDLGTRVVVPLLPPDLAPKPARGLNPAFDIDGQPHLMLTQFIAAVPAKELRTPVLSLDACSDDIMRAIGMLLIGYPMRRRCHRQRPTSWSVLMSPHPAISP